MYVRGGRVLRACGGVQLDDPPLLYVPIQST